MPIITVKAIQGVVLTSDAQKRELLQSMTDAFISVVGEVARPYTYCLIEETPLYEWSIAGRALPDLPFLYGPEYRGMHERANDIMRQFVASQQQPEASAPGLNGASGQSVSSVASESELAQRADLVWRGDDPAALHGSQEARNMAIIRRWMEEGWNNGNYEVAYEVISPTMQVHGAGGQPIQMGPAGLADLIRTWRNAFPDGYMTIEDLFARGDTIVIRNTWHGTHKGAFYGIAPTNRWVEITSIGMDRIVDGKVVDGWGEVNMLGAMQQMGVLPASPRGG